MKVPSKRTACANAHNSENNMLSSRPSCNNLTTATTNLQHTVLYLNTVPFDNDKKTKCVAQNEYMQVTFVSYQTKKKRNKKTPNGKLTG